MPWFNGFPYTSFKGVNARGASGFRWQDTTYPYGVTFKLAPGTNTDSEKVVYIPNSTTGGSLAVRGYHLTYGSATYQHNSGIAADTVYTATAGITGLKTTSLIFATICTTGAVPDIPLGARCTTASIANLYLMTLAATSAAGTVTINYAQFDPQTT